MHPRHHLGAIVAHAHVRRQALFIAARQALPIVLVFAPTESQGLERLDDVRKLRGCESKSLITQFAAMSSSVHAASSMPKRVDLIHTVHTYMDLVERNLRDAESFCRLSARLDHALCARPPRHWRELGRHCQLTISSSYRYPCLLCSPAGLPFGHAEPVPAAQVGRATRQGII